MIRLGLEIRLEIGFGPRCAESGEGVMMSLPICEPGWELFSGLWDREQGL